MSTPLSRRNFFTYMLVVGAVSFGISPLVAKEVKVVKVKKPVVKYQEKSTTGKTCKECVHFLPGTNECKLVEGKVNPKGWCTYYLKKA